MPTISEMIESTEVLEILSTEDSKVLKNCLVIIKSMASSTESFNPWKMSSLKAQADLENLIARIQYVNFTLSNKVKHRYVEAISSGEIDTREYKSREDRLAYLSFYGDREYQDLLITAEKCRILQEYCSNLLWTLKDGVSKIQ